MNSRDEWLEWRKHGLGASEVAAVMGLSPWASPWSVFADKVGLTTDESDNEAMEFGRRAEVMIAPWFADRTGLEVGGEQMWCHHPEHPHRRCTIDGLVFDATWDEVVEIDNAFGWLEVKTTSAPASEWEENGPPVHYQCQANWTSHVTDLMRGWFAVLHLAFGRPQFRVYEFTADEDDIARIVEVCDRFWAENILTGTPPATDSHGATTTALNAAWPEAQGQVGADDDMAKLVEQVNEARRWEKRLKEDINELENKLRARLGESTDLVDPDTGKNLATYRWQQRTRVDATAMRKAHPDIVDEFTETNQTRVLRVNQPKGQ